jgi:CRISPR-associated protein Cas2
MYIVVVYDVEQGRVNRVCQLLRRYLHWVQNSAFEGELSEAQLERLKSELSEIIDREKDSAYFYILEDVRWLRKEVLGRNRGSIDNLL